MTDTPQQYTATTDDAKKRLDLFLLEHFPTESRSHTQRRIKRGEVTVNGVVPSVHQFLKNGDVIVIGKETPATPPAPTRINARILAKTSGPLNIIRETSDYLIINKPAGVLVHPASEKKERTLVDMVLEKFPEIQQIGDDPSRPGIVHRLDRDVSGVMIVARTWEMFEHLKKEFRLRHIRKEYVALVHGTPAKDEDEIDFSIARSKRRPGRMSAKPDTSGRHASTRFTVEQRYPNYTLLRVFPTTGRMHQIRVHLHAYGLPIVGDPLYHARHHKNDLGIEQPLLASVKLTFTDTHGKTQVFEAPIPEHFERVLSTLK
ncbi:MAG: RluA family pseudouridine synthase [Patescibacteria group bacterium]|jgi:23S rRNA pseudouridine1911/1915/1917 synthase